MSDAYNVAEGQDPQSKTVLTLAEERKALLGDSNKGKKGNKGEDRPAQMVTTSYKEGIKFFLKRKFHVILSEGGDHVNHHILVPKKPPEVKGIDYPSTFQPLQEISSLEEFERLAAAHSEMDDETRSFWEPLVRPAGGDTDLKLTSERMLRLKNMERSHNIYEVLDYNHTFDPTSKIHGGGLVKNPSIWVPATEWFTPEVRKIRFDDIFTIFPLAEREILRLIIGRVGVGRSNHKPPGWGEPIEHTSRMAAVVVGKDAGLGKSTLFNSMNAAFSKCGFVAHTFKKTDDRFGLKAAALADIAYKDDTSMKTLKAFLSSEETKILVTGGLFQTEEKFLNSEQIWPKCALIVNSNDWSANFAYDLDPGIN